MFKALLEYNFLQNAAISAVLASIACGIIGTIIIEKKMVMMSGGIAHTAFGGIGMGYYLQIEPIIGGLFFSILAALGITTIHRKTHTNTDVLIGIFWSFGMALGIIFIAITPGYPPDMTSYLFGDILLVSRSNLIMLAVMDAVILSIIVPFFDLFKAYLFDEEFSAVLGLPVTLFEYTLSILIALTVVILIKVVGIILVIALLTTPAAIAKQFTYELKRVMCFAVITAIALCFSGLWLSYLFNIPSGASIILFSTALYLLMTAFNKVRKSGAKVAINEECGGRASSGENN